MYGLLISHLPERKQHWKGMYCTNKHWQHMAGSLDGAEFPRVCSHHSSSSNKPRFPPYQGMNSHLARIRHVLYQMQARSACRWHPNAICHSCVPRTVLQASSVSPLKTPCELETSGVWKVLSICRWKWILMPHKFPGNCPYLFIYWFIDVIFFLA